MDSKFKNLSLSLLVLAAYTTAQAGDGFIVQPKLKAKLNKAGNTIGTRQALTTEVELRPSHSGQPVGSYARQRVSSSREETDLMPLDHQRRLDSRIATELSHSEQTGSEQNSSEQNSSEQNSSEQNSSLRYTSEMSPIEQAVQPEPGLRWVARGTVVRSGTIHPSSSRGPTLEFDSDSAKTDAALQSQDTGSLLGSVDAWREASPTPPQVPASHQFMPRNNATQPARMENEQEDASQKQRHELVSLVSNRILDDSQSLPASGAVVPLESPNGWQAIGEQISKHLAACESLLKRNAFFSAREEAIQAMLHLVRRLDQAENRLHCEPAYLAARQAFNEADDFSVSQRLVSDETLLRRIVDSHETPILKSADLAQLSPMTAAQHYRLYAEQSLYEAAQGHPWASEVIYAIGRSYQAEADASDRNAESLLTRAVSHFRVAQRILPSNALASNQLGFIMLQVDRPIEAREMLLASIAAAPSAAALQNLMEAGRRLGDQQTLNWAAQSLTALQSQGRQPMGLPAVVEVDPRMFAAMSPRSSGPVPQLNGSEAHVSTASYSSAGGYR